MKISFIKSCLANYDTKKGFLRVLRDESHIGDLRTFFNQDLGGDKAVDRDLTPEELHELVAIALKKRIGMPPKAQIRLVKFSSSSAA